MTNRPISPHLQIYRFQLTSVLSILHRITGIALSVGTILLVYWLVAAASGPGAFATAAGLIGSWFGRLLLLGWTFALFFHLCNGIRHLFWDAGHRLRAEDRLCQRLDGGGSRHGADDHFFHRRLRRPGRFGMNGDRG